VKMPWTSLIEAIARAWSNWQERTRTPIPDLRDLRLEDARREVKIELEKQKLLEAKAKTAAMEADQTIK